MSCHSGLENKVLYWLTLSSHKCDTAPQTTCKSGTQSAAATTTSTATSGTSASTASSSRDESPLSDLECQMQMEPLINELAGIIKAGRPVLFVTGAGLSVASGIRTYRGEKGVWDEYVTSWGTTKKFAQNPDIWWNSFWLKTHQCPAFMEAEPNPAHLAIRDIINRHPAVSLITQNIDRLHLKSGVPISKHIEIHGALGQYRCTNGLKKGSPSPCIYTHKELHPPITLETTPSGDIVPPKCCKCQSPLLPFALFFDEAYKVHCQFRYEEALSWMDNAEAMVFVGTSLSVGITHTALLFAHGTKCPLFFFNTDTMSGLPTRTVKGPCTETLALLNARTQP
ncbi:NAD-dependent deacytelase Sir2 [Pelomyxa schiedti]|nr:NAD-dependent deacytelase Sir2 [Pelomyxa schiedti]